MNSEPQSEALSENGRMAGLNNGSEDLVFASHGENKKVIPASTSLLALLCYAMVIVLSSIWPASAQTVTYIHTDALGSVVAESDASGNVTRRYDYEPYGVVVGDEVPNGPGYTGHVSDAVTGLSYMQQRYMDPQLGVFLSVDPVSAYQEPVVQFNRYRYANGNPYRFTDPDGRNAAALVPLVIIPIVVGATYYATTTPERRAELGNKLEGAIKGLVQKTEPATPEPALQNGGSIAVDRKTGNEGGTSGKAAGGERGTIYVDSKGNAIPTPPGGKIEGSPDGRFVQAKGPDGSPTGVRIDGGHKPAPHPDPRAQQPHGHVPGVTNADGTPWLPLKK